MQVDVVDGQQLHTQSRHRTKLHLQHFRNSYDKSFFMLARHYLWDRCHVSAVNKMCTHARSNPPFRKSVEFLDLLQHEIRQSFRRDDNKVAFKEKRLHRKHANSNGKVIRMKAKLLEPIKILEISRIFRGAFVNNNCHSCFPFAGA